MSSAIEIRKNSDGTIDEIVGKCVDLHIEQLSPDGWFMSLSTADGRQWLFWVGAKNGRSHVTFRCTDEPRKAPERRPLVLQPAEAERLAPAFGLVEGVDYILAQKIPQAKGGAR